MEKETSSMYRDPLTEGRPTEITVRDNQSEIMSVILNSMLNVFSEGIKKRGSKTLLTLFADLGV